MNGIVRTSALLAAAAALLAVAAPLRAGTLINPGAVNARVKLEPQVALKARPFDMTDVKLLAGPFQHDMESEHQYLLGLDNDRLLYNFRVTAGLPTLDATPLAGWESPTTELRGHYVGHVLSGLALMYASTGDEQLKTKGAALVAELAKCQAALNSSGYLSAYPESMIMELINGTRRPWAPWYTLHKIMAGLLDQYVICDNTQALQVVEGMAGWTGQALAPLSDAQLQSMLQTEFGGMEEVLTNLYTVTGKPEYLSTAGKFYHNAVMDPLALKQDQLNGLHVNTQVPKMSGEAARYEMAGDVRDQTIADYFWDEVTHHRAYITGGASYQEYFHGPPDVVSTWLGPTAHENCVSYNLLKLTRHVFAWTADPKVADYYERNLFNAIMGTQNPAAGRGGSFMYSVPMAGGYSRPYNNQDRDFTCCLGTALESFAKLGDSIYFHDDHSVFVNLFIPSQLTWTSQSLTLTQATRFPYDEGTTLTVTTSAPTSVTLKIRIPYWANGSNSIRINGQPYGGPLLPDSYAAIQRTWQSGDTLAVSLPMRLHVEPTPDNPDVASIMYGPIVLAGKLPSSTVPQLVNADSRDPSRWLQKVDQATLSFKTVGVGQPADVTLVPFMDISGSQRYSIYWTIQPPAAATAWTAFGSR